MTVTRSGRRLTGVVLSVLMVAGCTQPTAGRPTADQAAAEQASAEAVKRGIEAFQSHFVNLGDDHARVYNYLNYGDVRITTEHESFKVGDPPAVVLKRRFSEDGDWSVTLTPPESPVDYIELDEEHEFLAPTPWVSVPTLFQAGFADCFVITAWVACHLDQAIGQTRLEAPDEQPNEARATEDGFEITTGALLTIMLDESFISVPEEKRDGLTEPMLNTMVPVLLQFDQDMNFTGFEIRDTITDGDETPLELQIEYEVLDEPSEEDIPEVPDASEVTVIPDQTAADAFFEKFNDRTPEN